MHIKHTIRTWSDKFKDLLIKSIIQFQFSNIIIELILKVFMFNIKWKDVVMVSGNPC